MMSADERRTPYPPPPGFHWEPTESRLHGGFACFRLVENGRSINAAGFYELYERGDRDVPNRPMPQWSTDVERERQVFKRTRTLVMAYIADQAEERRLDAMRARYRR